MERDNEVKNKRFLPTVSLGNLLAILAFLASGIGVYTQVIADVNNTKTEVANIKANEIKKEAADKEARHETKQEIKEVKENMIRMDNKLDRILEQSIQNGRRRNDSK